MCSNPPLYVCLFFFFGLQTKKEGWGAFWRERGGEGHFDVTIKTHSRPVERDERDGAEVK